MANDFAKKLEIMTEVFRNPTHLVQPEIKYLHYCMDLFPLEIATAELPPMKLRDHMDGFEIDGVLGNYNPDTRTITTFKVGIEHVSRLLNVSAEDLTYVVKLHEHVHALLHLGVPKNILDKATLHESFRKEYLGSSTHWFKNLENDIHERLAQIFTYYALCAHENSCTHDESRKKVGRVKEVFLTLEKHQPAAYQISHLLEVPKTRVIESVPMLKECKIIGLETWEKILKW